MVVVGCYEREREREAFDMYLMEISGKIWYHWRRVEYRGRDEKKFDSHLS
jgi:hypothetical protein